MTERSLHWNGASVGDADLLTVNAADGIGYRLANEDYESPFVDVGHRMLYNGDGNRGPLNNWQNELAVAAGAGMSVDVATGGAIVYGVPYENTAVVNVAIPAPTTDTRYDRIVLRRNWATQTVRITRLPGVEGGSAPSITQSPAPSGTGIYDIPLAIVQATTAPAIGTITDEREFCRFGGVPGTGAIGSTQITNSSITWPDRATRTYRHFVGGGCMEPAANASTFRYTDAGGVLTFTGAPTWGGGAANVEAWRVTGATYIAGYVSFAYPPPNYVSGDIRTYIWWEANGAIASTFYVRSAAHGRGQYGYTGIYTHELYIADGDADWIGGYHSVYINETTVANQFYRTAGLTITPCAADATPWRDNYNDNIRSILYLAFWYNSAGAEDVNFMGVELEYTGYV